MNAAALPSKVAYISSLFNTVFVFLGGTMSGMSGLRGLEGRTVRSSGELTVLRIGPAVLRNEKRLGWLEKAII